MKKLTKLLLLIFTMVFIASCGKNNSSGSSSASPATGGGTTTTTDNFYADGSNSFGDFEKLKDFYLQKDFNTNLANGTIVYHIGPAFGAKTSSTYIKASFSACISLFGIGLNKGCYNSGNSVNSQYQQIVNNGEYKIIDSVDANANSLRVATGSSGSNFLFSSQSFNSNTRRFREMLNTDNLAVRKVVVTKANVTLADGSKLDADFVEYFYTNNSKKRFVLAPSLPHIANPVATVDDYGNFTGLLNNVGTLKIKSIQVIGHDVQVDIYTGEVRISNKGTSTYTL